MFACSGCESAAAACLLYAILPSDSCLEAAAGMIYLLVIVVIYVGARFGQLKPLQYMHLDAVLLAVTADM